LIQKGFQALTDSRFSPSPTPTGHFLNKNDSDLPTS
jgi:hypothetical protein